MASLVSNTHKKIATILHLKQIPTSDLDIALQLRKGIPFAAVNDTCKLLHISQADLSRYLAINPRTLGRRRQAKKLHSDESNKLYRLIKIYILAIAVIENKQHAIRWLQSPKVALGGEIPLELLDTDAGSREVELLLQRIEHGILS